MSTTSSLNPYQQLLAKQADKLERAAKHAATIGKLEIRSVCMIEELGL